MNTFAVILLAFPFYLAVKGRLAGYIALAKPTAAAPSPAPSVAAATPAPAPAASSAGSPAPQTLTDAMAAVSGAFANTSGAGVTS